MNAWVFAVVLALAVATAYAGNLGLGAIGYGAIPISTGVISSRVIAAPTLVAAHSYHPTPILRSGLVAAPLATTGIIGTRTIIGAPALAAPLGLAAAPIW